MTISVRKTKKWAVVSHFSDVLGFVNLKTRCYYCKNRSLAIGKGGVNIKQVQSVLNLRLEIIEVYDLTELAFKTKISVEDCRSYGFPSFWYDWENYIVGTKQEFLETLTELGFQEILVWHLRSVKKTVELDGKFYGLCTEAEKNELTRINNLVRTGVKFAYSSELDELLPSEKTEVSFFYWWQEKIFLVDAKDVAQVNFLLSNPQQKVSVFSPEAVAFVEDCKSRHLELRPAGDGRKVQDLLTVPKNLVKREVGELLEEAGIGFYDEDYSEVFLFWKDTAEYSVKKEEKRLLFLEGEARKEMVFAEFLRLPAKEFLAVLFRSGDKRSETLQGLGFWKFDHLSEEVKTKIWNAILENGLRSEFPTGLDETLNPPTWDGEEPTDIFGGGYSKTD